MERASTVGLNETRLPLRQPIFHWNWTEPEDADLNIDTGGRQRSRNANKNAGGSRSTRQLVQEMFEQTRMDGRFMTLEHETLKGEPYSVIKEKGKRYYLSPKGKKIRRAMVSVKNENLGALAKCQFLNGMAEAMLAPSKGSSREPPYLEFFHSVGNRTWKPDLVGLHDLNPEDSALTPDLIVLKRGQKELSPVLDMADVAAIGEDRLKPQNDTKADLLLQLFEYQRKQILNQPLAGDLVSFTMAGARFRLWCTDPVSFIGSKVCDLTCEDDATISRFIDLLALLIGPLEHLCPGWIPDDTFTFTPLSEDPSREIRLHSTITQWTAGDSTQPNGILRIRGDIHGGRTVGSFGRGTINGETSTLVVKQSFLPKKYRYHEFKIFQYIKTRHDSNEHEAMVKEIPNHEDVYNRLPQCLGAIDLPYMMPCRDHPDPAVRDQLSEDDKVVMSALLFQNEPHRPVRESLGLRTITSIAYDASLSLWLVSAYGCHYRDLNLGNILVDIDGRGRVIDFGNALTVGARRHYPEQRSQFARAIADCEDDGRSGNVYFLSTASIIGQDLTRDLKQAYGSLEALEKSGERDEFFGRKLKVAKNQIATLETNIYEHHTHRYTDDLESLLYVLSYQLIRSLHDPINPILETHPVYKLDNSMDKQVYWKGNLKSLVVNSTHPLIEDMIVDLATIVRNHQELFRERYKASELPVHLTQEEQDCFKAFTTSLKGHLDGMVTRNWGAPVVPAVQRSKPEESVERSKLVSPIERSYSQTRSRKRKINSTA